MVGFFTPINCSGSAKGWQMQLALHVSAQPLAAHHGSQDIYDGSQNSSGRVIYAVQCLLGS